MCGICGFTGQIKEKEDIVKKMTETITHRGPDSDGYYIDDFIAMGFRRLSIIDLEKGNQPIYNKNKNLVLNFNGEIYNYKEIKKELQDLGYTFTTDSDSEVLVHGFEEWGEDLVLKLRGMFVFVIYNTESKNLFFARDPFGIKPLHYTMIGEDLCYASEIKSILEHPNFKKEFNEKALDAYLSFQYCPQPMTFFKHVYCLMSGHFMWFRDGVVETQKYFEPRFRPNNEMTEDEAVEAIDKVFEDSIKAHKIADVEVGCFLSSGVDSSYVTSYFKDQKAFTVGFDFGEKYNEISYAENLAKELGVEHYTKLISSEEFWAAIPTVQYHMDQPLADPSCIALYFVAKLASEHVKVVLSGEGADELFGGYTCYNNPRVFKWYQKIVPYPLRKFIAAICRHLPDIKGRDYLIRACHPIEKGYIGNAYMYNEREKKQILKDPSIATDPVKMCRRYYTRARRYDDETKMQYIDINTWLIGDILLKADRMSMANSLELRVPFLDKEVFEVASKLPTDLRVNKYNTKYAMRGAAAKHLPEATAEKEKLGFPVPTRVWLRDEHYFELVEEMFSSYTAQKFFNTDILIDYLKEHYVEHEDYSRKIWTVYTFLIWYEIYFGKVKFEDLPEEEQEAIAYREEMERQRAEEERLREEEERARAEREAAEAEAAKIAAQQEKESPFEEKIPDAHDFDEKTIVRNPDEPLVIENFEDDSDKSETTDEIDDNDKTRIFKPVNKNMIIQESQKEIESDESSETEDQDTEQEETDQKSAFDLDDPDAFFENLKTKLDGQI